MLLPASCKHIWSCAGIIGCTNLRVISDVHAIQSWSCSALYCLAMCIFQGFCYVLSHLITYSLPQALQCLVSEVG